MKKEQYETLLAVLADKVKEQGVMLSLKDYEIERLTRKLAEAEGMETAQSQNHGKYEIR
jgi:hypothetical protein